MNEGIDMDPPGSGGTSKEPLIRRPHLSQIHAGHSCDLRTSMWRKPFSAPRPKVGNPWWILSILAVPASTPARARVGREYKGSCSSSKFAILCLSVARSIRPNFDGRRVLLLSDCDDSSPEYRRTFPGNNYQIISLVSDTCTLARHLWPRKTRKWKKCF